MLVTSISGIRGILNQDLSSSDIAEFSRNFARLTDSGKIIIAKDTRTTGEIISKVVSSALLGSGLDVLDYGVVSTPAIFRESRSRGLPAIIITASHNGPEWNGLKFVVNGRGIQAAELQRILEKRRRSSKEREKGKEMTSGRLKSIEQFSYNSDLTRINGENACEGVKVVLDLNGGAAIRHAPAILRTLGCEVITLGDTPSLFIRRIDPTADELNLLRKMVVSQAAHIGLAFDCDGDRLVIVDSEGKKRSGDYMLTLALKEILSKNSSVNVVVSVDTTQAIHEMVSEAGGKVFESKVGEANVLQKMTEVGAAYGGEGSSGGLIDSNFNSCRDSMVAAITIIKALKEKGTKLYDRVRDYHQSRVALGISRSKAERIIRSLQKERPEVNRTDGIKISTSRSSWVLIRASGTEDLIRVSAEARSAKEAEELVESFQRKVKNFS